MPDHFYLTLSSGVTKLPERMRLDGDYEVAISDFAYPHNWFNVNNGDDRYWIGAYNFVTNQFPFPKFFVKSGYYKDEETFVSSLIQQAAEAFANVSVKFTFVKHLHPWAQTGPMSPCPDMGIFCEGHVLKSVDMGVFCL
jgi:hypothetical protein